MSYRNGEDSPQRTQRAQRKAEERDEGRSNTKKDNDSNTNGYPETHFCIKQRRKNGAPKSGTQNWRARMSASATLSDEGGGDTG